MILTAVGYGKTNQVKVCDASVQADKECLHLNYSVVIKAQGIELNSGVGKVVELICLALLRCKPYIYSYIS